jgi:predicted dehydrogenase
MADYQHGRCFLNVLIFGTGSIGKRHIENIESIVPSSNFYIYRDNGLHDKFSLELKARIINKYSDILNLSIDFAVVATPSALHINPLIFLIQNNIPVYIEKPVVSNEEQLDCIKKVLNSTQYTAPTLVGCNLRFLPAIKKMKRMIEGASLGKIIRANFQAGQWLPDWRAGRDYRQSYSASSLMGGGVILDLIHEIDLARWFFGEYDRVLSESGRYSELDIDSEDTAVMILSSSSKKQPLVSVSLDYVSRVKVRRYEVVGTKGSLTLDLQLNKFIQTSPEKGVCIQAISDEDSNTSQTYIAAMAHFIDCTKNKNVITDYSILADGIKTVELAIKAKKTIIT